MEGRDALSHKAFCAKAGEVLAAARGDADTRVDAFLKALRNVLVKEAPPQVRAREVVLAGSYLLGTTLSTDPSITLLVTAPQSACGAADVRRHCWRENSAAYVKSLAEYLRSEHRMMSSVEPLAESFTEHVVAIVGPAVEGRSGGGGGGGNWTIRLRAVLPPSEPLLAHFRDANVVRASPSYSQEVMAAMLTPSLFEALQGTVGSVSTARDAAVLLRLWGGKQGLCGAQPDGLTETVLLSLLHYLVRRGLIAEGMGAAQAFRLGLQFLADPPRHVDLDPPPAGDTLRGEADAESPEQRLRSAHAAHAPAVFAFRGWNVWSDATRQAVAEVRRAARLAVETLDHSSPDDAIETLFKIPSPFYLRYDMYVALQYPPHVKVSFRKAPPAHDAALSVRRDFAVLVNDLLEEALGDGLASCTCRLQAGHVVFGLGFAGNNALRARRVVGPSLLDRAAADAFVATWGSRAANLPHEGVVRKGASFSDAADDADFVKMLLACLLRDLGEVPRSIRVLGQGAARCLHVPRPNGPPHDPAEPLHQRARRSLAELTRFLQNVDDFPLDILQVNEACDGLAGTAVAPPRPHSTLLRPHDPKVPDELVGYGDSLTPFEVVVEVAKSSAWPDHREAIAHIRTALHCKLAQRLRKERRLVCIPRRECLDVLLHGFIFRLRINHPREALLLDTLGMKQEAAALRKRMELTPKHTSFVQTFARAFAYFSPAVRMLKRWAAAHYLAGYVSEQALELVMCRIFSRKPSPLSVLSAFVRALHLIASWDWEDLPLIVPPVTGEFTAISRKRPAGPAMWFNTPYDSDHSCFSAATPNGTMLTRLRQLSEAALRRYFAAMGDLATPETWEAKWLPLFQSSLKPFDLVVSVAKDAIPHPEAAIGSTKAPGDAADLAKHPRGYLFRPGGDTRREEMHKMINYQPVAWLIAQYRINFREVAMFGYDPYGGSVITVVGLRKFTSEEAETLAHHLQAMGRGIVKRAQVSLALQPAGGKSPAASPAASPAQQPKAAKAKAKAKAKPAVKRKAAEDSNGAAAPAEGAPAKKRAKKVVKKVRKN